jgi:hypothetical protein
MNKLLNYNTVKKNKYMLYLLSFVSFLLLLPAFINNTILIICYGPVLISLAFIKKGLILGYLDKSDLSKNDLSEMNILFYLIPLLLGFIFFYNIIDIYSAISILTIGLALKYLNNVKDNNENIIFDKPTLK